MRIRTVKPEFFNHEGIYDAEHETKLPLRLSFIGLWCVADREGRFKWEPRRLKVKILPYDSIDFSRVLDALHTRGFIVKYASESETFGCIPSFNRHQVINNRERPSELPDPYDCYVCDASATREARDEHAGKEEGKGKEGNKERKGREGEHEILPPPIADNYFHLPKESPMHALMKRINGLHPTWSKPAQWNRMEMEELNKGTGGQLSELTNEDWDTLREYLSKPTEKGYWRPVNRSKFVETFPDVWQACQRWQDNQPKKPKEGERSVYR